MVGGGVVVDAWLETLDAPGADVQLERVPRPSGRRGLHRQLALAAEASPLLHAAGPAKQFAEDRKRQRCSREGPPCPAFGQHALQVALDAERNRTTAASHPDNA